jgi:hypothetical protein
LAEVQTVVVDSGLDEKWQREMREAGVRLLLAEPEARGAGDAV